MIRCPECEKGILVQSTRDEEFNFDIGDKIIRVVAYAVPVEQCDKCGLITSGAAAAKVRHEAVCLSAGFPTPTEQKSIRTLLGWSQQYLADVIGVEVDTVRQSEQGRILASSNYYKMLLLLR